MPDYRITLEVKNVADGDIRMLCNELLARYGEDFDASHNDFYIRTSKREGQSGENYFPFDWEEVES